MNKATSLIKLVTIAAFMVTLWATYHLRSEVLALSKVRFSSENLRAEDNLREMKESYPVRVAEYEIQLKNHELEMAHYQEMLTLYRTDYNAYVTRLKDGYRPPQLPDKPQKPKSPELSDKMAAINADFRAQQFHYFDSSRLVNWVCCASALVLVGGLLFLIMFETGNTKIVYVVILVLSFVFMIGPSFHSIMSAIVGFLKAPPIY